MKKMINIQTPTMSSWTPVGIAVCGRTVGSATTLSTISVMDTVVMELVRDRKGATKGHVAFDAAYVPGPHAWSPPI